MEGRAALSYARVCSVCQRLYLDLAGPGRRPLPMYLKGTCKDSRLAGDAR